MSLSSKTEISLVKISLLPMPRTYIRYTDFGSDRNFNSLSMLKPLGLPCRNSIFVFMSVSVSYDGYDF